MTMRPGNNAMVVGADLSTYPGLNEPIIPVEAGQQDVLNKEHNRVHWKVTLKPDWSPTDITVPLPLRLWNARCLILNGLADADVLDAELNDRRVLRVDQDFKPDPRSSRAWVQLYGSDYTGTTLGPFKAVFALIQVRGARPDGLYFRWWRYYGTSLLNKEFKEKVWGIKPNRLAVVETDYAGKRKAVRLVDGGRVALKMTWNSGRFPHLKEDPQSVSFKTVAPDRYDGGENDIELGAIFLKRWDSERPFRFDRHDDEFWIDERSELGHDLTRIGFEPEMWQCMLNYGGVVKIYDEHGRGTPPNGPGANGKGAHQAVADELAQARDMSYQLLRQLQRSYEAALGMLVAAEGERPWGR
jgi:hypothetical protein